MKDHPLLYTSEMVIRILTCAKCGKISIKFPCCHCGSEEFCKTHTRRVPVERYRKWKVGEMIWVREAWCYAAMSGYDAREDGGEIWYRATDAGMCEGPWKPSIHMFRKYARIWLEITGLRDERVQDISVEDAEKEGLSSCVVDPYPRGCFLGVKGNYAKNYCDETDMFMDLWDSLNAKRHKGIYAWGKNPEVKVIEFKRVQDYL